MDSFHIYSASILILIFLIITYLLSGLEKVSDWNGNVSFIKSHFKSSPLKNYVPFLLSIILVVELLAGAFMFVGIFHLLIMNDTKFASLGLELSGVTLIFLLVGQRLAKDYQGSMSLAVYFILTIFGLFLLNN